MAGKRGILFLCTENSTRSQMAEGFAKMMAPKGVKVYSAGTRPTSVNPLAIRVMSEVDVDISRHRAKGTVEVPLSEIDALVTLCDRALQSCPTVIGPGLKFYHWDVDDPAASGGEEESVLQAFRRVRDEIRSHVREFIASDVV